jgi:hypothetical protein
MSRAVDDAVGALASFAGTPPACGGRSDKEEWRQ